MGRISKRSAAINYSNRTVKSSNVLPLHRFVGQLQKTFLFTYCIMEFLNILCVFHQIEVLKSQDASGQIRMLNEQLLTIQSEKSRLANDLTTSQMKEQQLRDQLTQTEQVCLNISTY